MSCYLVLCLDFGMFLWPFRCTLGFSHKEEGALGKFDTNISRAKVTRGQRTTYLMSLSIWMTELGLGGMLYRQILLRITKGYEVDESHDRLLLLKR